MFDCCLLLVCGREDNTNLDKARQLLWPIKEKYGLGLSWGDLFTLAGTTAIQDMGGPMLGFCGGRPDDSSGEDSLPLGPSEIQEEVYPCEVNGNCTSPLGSTTVGLIYLNPEGPMGQPIPEQSAPQIRDAFGRMGMNDTETVALIGGGHAFGKTHGACPLGAGPNPSQDPANPWPGLCGTGKGNDTFTSGFEGPWTTTPTTWSNQYFHNLLNFDWQKHIGPGGHWQWNVSDAGGPDIMMLTSDVSLLTDPEYLALVQRFANDMDYFTDVFKHAWYKLVSRDVGPVWRCTGDLVPPAQPFQFPLPPPATTLPNFDDVSADIITVINTPNDAVLPMDSTGSYGPLFVRLAWQCANTFRHTDFMGGCNGARIRYSPENEWTNNGGLNSALELLQGVKDTYGDSLSWADLIVLAGNTAIVDAASKAGVVVTSSFVGGRSDQEASNANPTPDYLESRLTGGQSDDAIDIMKDTMNIMGLTAREYVALIGGGHTLGQMHQNRSGFVDGAWTTTPAKLNTEFFQNLINLDWSQQLGDDEHIEYESAVVLEDGSSVPVYMLLTDMNLRSDSEYRAIVQEYASDVVPFYEEFLSAWGKVMNADLNATKTQDDIVDPSSSGDNDDDDSVIELSSNGLIGVIGAIVVVLAATIAGAFFMGKRHAQRQADENRLSQSLISNGK